MGLTHIGGQLDVVFTQLCQHVFRRHEVGVVVQQALQFLDVADGADRGAPQLAYTLGNGIGGRVDLVSLLVEQQVEITEMRAGHVPVEILGLHVDGEGVCEQRVHFGCNIDTGLFAQCRRCPQIGLSAFLGGFQVFHGGSSWQRLIGINVS